MEDALGTGMTNMGQLLEKEFSRVNNFYEKSAEWSSMKITDRMSFIQENADLFAGAEGEAMLKAFETGDVEATLRKEKSDITDMEGWTYCDIKSSLYVSTNPNVTVLKTGEVLYTVESMKAKFSDQYSRIGERVDDSIKIAVKK